MTPRTEPWLTTDGPRIADVRVVWTLHHPPPAVLRAVADDVRRQVRAKHAAK